MTDRISAQELIDGYDVLFSPELRLAHEAVLTYAAETEPDGWPTVPVLIRFAKCYGVPLEQLAGLCGVLVRKIGNRTVFSDSRRCPELVNRINANMWNRRVLVAYGFYATAARMTMRDGDRVH